LGRLLSRVAGGGPALGSVMSNLLRGC